MKKRKRRLSGDLSARLVRFRDRWKPARIDPKGHDYGHEFEADLQTLLLYAQEQTLLDYQANQGKVAGN